MSPSVAPTYSLICLLRQTIRSLYETLHRRGVVHGDICSRHIRIKPKDVAASLNIDNGLNKDMDNLDTHSFRLIDFDQAELVRPDSRACEREMSEVMSWLKVGMEDDLRDFLAEMRGEGEGELR